MAASTGQGTGKHPHKSAEEPFEHHEASSATKGSDAKSSDKSHSSGEAHASGSKTQGSESSDLKSREYTDKEGNVHHHTKAHEEQHKVGK